MALKKRGAPLSLVELRAKQRALTQREEQLRLRATAAERQSYDAVARVHLIDKAILFDRERATVQRDGLRGVRRARRAR